MSGRGQLDRDRTASDVVAEAEVLVAGTVGRSQPSDRHLPGWVWVNLLAHARLSELDAIADGITIFRPLRWSGAIGCLASAVICTAGLAHPGLGQVEGVLRVQRGTLIPLELDLLGAGSTAPDNPEQLVSLVAALLDEYERR